MAEVGGGFGVCERVVGGLSSIAIGAGADPTTELRVSEKGSAMGMRHGIGHGEKSPSAFEESWRKKDKQVHGG